MGKKKKSINMDVYNDCDQESDEYFYYIAGYTSNGVPFGITWEQAVEDGLVESNSTTDQGMIKKNDAVNKLVENNSSTGDIPF